jgi:hypothetical protein
MRIRSARFQALLLPLVPLLLSCAAQPSAISHVRVVAREYAFGFPASLPAGQTAFRLINDGTVRHELQLYRFKPGIPRDTALRMLATDQIPDSAVDVDGGVLVAGASDSTVQELLVTLRRGDVYALECVFRDAPGQPRHRDLGMVAIVQVE